MFQPSPKGEADVTVNWDVIKSAMVELKLPLEVCDRKAIQAARFKQCFTFLVMLYFLQNLSENHDFSVDFAHPIDGKLAKFLQSTASVQCLARGGGLNLDDIPGSFSLDDDQFSVNSANSFFQQSNFSSFPPYQPPPTAPQPLEMLSEQRQQHSLLASQHSAPTVQEQQPKVSKLNDPRELDVSISPSRENTSQIEESPRQWKRDHGLHSANERTSITSVVRIQYFTYSFIAYGLFLTIYTGKLAFD